MSKTRISRVTVDEAKEILTFDFYNPDGSLYEGIHIHMSDFSPAIVKRLALHGLEQKIRDSYAGVSDPAQAFGLAHKVWDALKAGNWTVRGGGQSEPRPDSLDLLAQAIVAAAAAAGRGLEYGAVRDKLKSLDRSAITKLRSDPRVAVELARLRGKPASAIEEIF